MKRCVEDGIRKLLDERVKKLGDCMKKMTVNMFLCTSYLLRCTKRKKSCLYLLNSLRTFQKVRVYSHYLSRYQRQENCDTKIVCGTWTAMWHQRFLQGEYKHCCVFFIGLHSVIRLYEFALMIEACCETLVRFCQATQCHVSEDATPHELHYGELLTL